MAVIRSKKVSRGIYYRICVGIDPNALDHLGSFAGAGTAPAVEGDLVVVVAVVS